MRLREVIWKDQFVEKIERKHGVSAEESEEVLFSSPVVRRIGKGQVKGEDLYAAYGETEAGRHLVVFFVRKREVAALPISAREMTNAERRYYAEREGTA